jgi:hypothetical protein
MKNPDACLHNFVDVFSRGGNGVEPKLIGRQCTRCNVQMHEAECVRCKLVQTIVSTGGKPWICRRCRSS